MASKNLFKLHVHVVANYFFLWSLCPFLALQHILQRYRKVPKFSDAKKLCCNLPKIKTKRPNLKVFCQKHADGIANSEDPDQTAPRAAVWSGSAFCPDLSAENLGSLS